MNTISYIHILYYITVAVKNISVRNIIHCSTAVQDGAQCYSSFELRYTQLLIRNWTFIHFHPLPPGIRYNDNVQFFVHYKYMSMFYLFCYSPRP